MAGFLYPKDDKRFKCLETKLLGLQNLTRTNAFRWHRLSVAIPRFDRAFPFL